MFTLQIKKEELIVDYPNQLEKWLEAAEVLGKKIEDESKLEFYYSYGSFIPKILNSSEEYYIDMFDKFSKMPFDERFEHELSKIRVNASFKIKNFFISDRMVGEIPSIIRDIICEVTKVRMLVEYEHHLNESIKDSIPPIDPELVSYEIIREVIDSDVDLDTNSILEKISKNGINSLTKTEKEFLNKKSKDI